MFKLTFAAAVSLVTFAAPASAATYFFTFSGGATGSGAFEVNPFSAGAGMVTAASGTINGQTITGLRPVNNFVNDNVLLFGDNTAKFTSAGVGVWLGDVRADLFYNYGIGNHRLFLSNSGVQSIDFNLQSAVAAVPEPTTWALMLLGFGAVGGAIRYRRRATSVAFA